MILGLGASGKSTLAIHLSDITGLPVIELDKIFWQPGLVATSRAQLIKLQERLVEEDGWIIDADLGPYDAVEVRLQTTDTVVFWTSQSFDVLGEQFDDPASEPIFGFGCCGLAAEAVRFSWK